MNTEALEASLPKCKQIVTEYTYKQRMIHDVILTTSLLRRLQAQTLPGATLPFGKIQPLSKMTIAFEPVMAF